MTRTHVRGTMVMGVLGNGVRRVGRNVVESVLRNWVRIVRDGISL